MKKITLLSRLTLSAGLALGALSSAGCGAEDGISPDAVGSPGASSEQFLEDTGTPEQDEAMSMAKDGKADILGIVGTVCGVVNVVQGISDSKATEWKAMPSGGSLTSGGLFDLLDTHANSYVKYGERDWGINLVWSSSAPGNVAKLVKAGGGTLKYGDRVALNFKSGGYVKYESRRWGINLVWSSTPVYEWEVRGGTTGNAVPKGTAVRLFNATENDNLVYCRRPVGINLGWAKDCTDVPGIGRTRTGYCP